MSETNFVRLSKTLTLGAMAGVGVKLTGADVEALVRTITGMGEEIETLNARIAEFEAERRWIPVSERLPEDGEVVWLWDGNNLGMGYYLIFSGCFMDRDTPLRRIKPTHWMSLPTPPEVK